MVRDHALCFDEQWKFSMKFIIPHDNGVWVRDSVVSEPRVATLVLYGLESSQEYPLIPTCSTLQCGIRAVGCSIGPGWARNPLTKAVGYRIGPR